MQDPLKDAFQEDLLKASITNTQQIQAFVFSVKVCENDVRTIC